MDSFNTFLNSTLDAIPKEILPVEVETSAGENPTVISIGVEKITIDRPESLVALLHKWSVTAEGFWGHLLQSISVVKL